MKNNFSCRLYWNTTPCKIFHMTQEAKITHMTWLYVNLISSNPSPLTPSHFPLLTKFHVHWTTTNQYLQKYGSSFQHFNVNKKQTNNAKPINIIRLIPAFSTFLLLKSINKYQLIFQYIKYINSIQAAVIFLWEGNYWKTIFVYNFHTIFQMSPIGGAGVEIYFHRNQVIDFQFAPCLCSPRSTASSGYSWQCLFPAAWLQASWKRNLVGVVLTLLPNLSLVIQPCGSVAAVHLHYPNDYCWLPNPLSHHQEYLSHRKYDSVAAVRLHCPND